VALPPAIAVLAVWNMLRPSQAVLACAGVLTLLLIVLGWQRLQPGLRRVALVLAVLTAALLPLSPTPWQSLLRGVAIGTLMASLILSVSLLAQAALRSNQMRTVTAHLLAQGTSRRYLSFSIACQVFGGMLGMAGAQLLMNMAAQDDAPMQEDRQSMFLAITRSFTAASLWSPMFSNTAVLLALYPSLTWFALFPMGLLMALGAVAIGQGLDRWRLAGRAPEAARPVPAEPLGPTLRGMLLAMAGFLGVVMLAGWLLHVMVAGVIIALAPIAALVLAYALARPPQRWRQVLADFRADVERLPTMTGEVTLFMAAACGGTVIASAIPVGWITAIGSGLGQQPMFAVLALILFVVGLASLAVHPVLSAVLVASCFPPEVLHLRPLPHLCAILVGWAVAGAFTPFSIINLMASRQSGVPLLAISVRANGLFALLCITLATLTLAGVTALAPAP
jgi:hypothetical protein